MDTDIRELDPWAITDADLDRYVNMMPKDNPQTRDEEYRRLRIMIQTEGQTSPVEIFQGGVVDGRRRILVCRELQRPCLAKFMPDDYFPDAKAIELHILRVQLSRRNSTGRHFFRMIAREEALCRADGVLPRDFRVKKASDLGVTPDNVKDIVKKGRDLNRLADGIEEAVLKKVSTDAIANSIFSRLCLLDHDSQHAVVQSCDSDKSMRSEIERRLVDKADAAFQDRLPTPTTETDNNIESGPPLNPHEAMTFSILHTIEQAIRMLVLLCDQHETPAAKNTLKLLEKARKQFLEVRQS